MGEAGVYTINVAGDINHDGYSKPFAPYQK